MSNPRACQPLKVKALAPVVRDLTPEYEGPYTIEPSSQSSVVVPVQGKKMTQDLTVERATLEELNVSVTQNGETRIEAEEGYLGLSGVNLTTNVQPPLQSKSVEYDANVEQTIAPDNGYYGLSSVNVKVDIKDEEANLKDVNFYDFDGKRLYSYTKSEFLALTSFPNNPVHENLIADGWNWDLSDAKDYVTKYTELDIGQTYHTKDGKTRIYIALNEGRLTPCLELGLNGTAHIEWGDGNEDNLTGYNLSTRNAIFHTYSNPGNYIISITPPEGEGERLRLQSDSTFYSCLISNRYAAQNYQKVYQNSVERIDFGDGFTTLSSRGLGYLQNLKEVMVPLSITTFGSSLFYYCTNLRAFVFPKTTVSIGGGTFYGCQTMQQCCLSKSIVFSSSNDFRENTILKRICLPDYSTMSAPFYRCVSLSHITIPELVESIGGGAFESCYGLGKITFTSLTPPTVNAYNVFNQIPTDCKIYVPQASLNDYKTATNYPNPNTYTYIGY